VNFTADERAILLVALHELRITRSAFDDDPDRDNSPIATIRTRDINDLALRLGGDAPIFGASVSFAHPR